MSKMCLSRCNYYLTLTERRYSGQCVVMPKAIVVASHVRR